MANKPWQFPFESSSNLLISAGVLLKMGHDRGVSPRMLHIVAKLAIGEDKHGQALVKPVGGAVAVEQVFGPVAQVVKLASLQHHLGEEKDQPRWH